MKTNNCPLCKSRALAGQPIPGRGQAWDVACVACGLVLFGPNGTSRAKLVAEWNRLKAAAKQEPESRKVESDDIVDLGATTHFWFYRVPGRAPEHWDKIIEISITLSTSRQNERHVRELLRIILNVKRLPIDTQVWPARHADVEETAVVN